LFEERFDDHERLAVLALLVKDVGKPDLEGVVVAGLGESLPVLVLRLVEAAQTEQGFGQVLAQRQIVGRDAQGVAQGLDGRFTAKHDASISTNRSSEQAGNWNCW
jgi:hypothetical protein